MTHRRRKSWSKIFSFKIFWILSFQMAYANSLPLWKIPLDSLTEMQTRPLFSENRQGLREETPPPPPPPPTDTPVVVAPPETLQATLLGVLRSADEFGLAVVKEQAGDKIRHIKVGDIFQGWKLSSVNSGEAIFEREGQKVRLQLPKHQFKGASIPAQIVSPMEEGANLPDTENMPPSEAASEQNEPQAPEALPSEPQPSEPQASEPQQ